MWFYCKKNILVTFILIYTWARTWAGNKPTVHTGLRSVTIYDQYI